MYHDVSLIRAIGELLFHFFVGAGVFVAGCGAYKWLATGWEHEDEDKKDDES